ncbi:MAG: NAD-dependent epimerase/dehydratase family protein [Gemmatimonadaceae bacterium]|nr:NAD-dependent epimerase/dehydratase family protein [Gemmatimonadaceae bacterium]
MASTLTRADHNEAGVSHDYPAPAEPQQERVLVTGATGFAGSAMLRALVGGGYRVRALVRDRSHARALELAGVEVAVGNMKDSGTLTRAVRDVSTVYHFASIFRQAGLPDEEFRSVNVEGPSRLIIAAAGAGVSRVVHISTVGVHGDIEHPPATEDSPFGAGDIYQNTKLEGEQQAVCTAVRLGVPLTVVRPAPMYGPRDRRLLKIFRGVAHRRFPILGKGDALFSMVHIDDLVEGVRRAGESPAAIGRTYIIGSDEFLSLNALVGLIAEEAGVKPLGVHLPVWPFWLAGAICEGVCAPLKIEPPLYRRRVAFFTKSRAFDITRARTELGHEPRISLREGVRSTLAWYREAGWI